MKRFKIGEVVKVRRYEEHGKIIEKIGSGKNKRYKVKIDTGEMKGKIVIEHPDLMEHLGE